MNIIEFSKELGFIQNSDRFCYFNTKPFNKFQQLSIQITHIQRYQISIYRNEVRIYNFYQDYDGLFYDLNNNSHIINTKEDFTKLLYKCTGEFKQYLRKSKLAKI